jgi:hypothetical protein
MGPAASSSSERSCTARCGSITTWCVSLSLCFLPYFSFLPRALFRPLSRLYLPSAWTWKWRHLPLLLMARCFTLPSSACYTATPPLPPVPAPALRRPSLPRRPLSLSQKPNNSPITQLFDLPILTQQNKPPTSPRSRRSASSSSRAWRL